MAESVLREADGEYAVAPGVYRFGSPRVNWYLVEADDRLTVVDAGLAGHWSMLTDGVAALGYTLDDIEACVLTHAHVDHIGFAARLAERGVPVWLHPDDVELASEAGGPPPGRFLQNLWRPSVLSYFLGLVRAGVLSPDAVTDTFPYADGETLDVPGAPEMIHVPGHTAGSCVLYLPERDTLLCGDALVTYDFLRGRGVEPTVAEFVSADYEQALASLDRLRDLGTVTLLPGHGEPWTGDLEAAVDRIQGRTAATAR